MNWLRRFFGGKNDKPAPQSEVPEPHVDRPLTELEQMAAQQAQRLVEIINDSLVLSRNSANPGTKVSRLELARQRLKDLESLSLQYPVIQITRAPQVWAQIDEFAREYAAAGHYAQSDISLRDYGHQALDRVYVNDSNHDLIDGWTFHATLQLRTPLRILEREGEFCPLPGPPPSIATEMWHGIWLPKTKTWRDRGVDIPEFTGTGRSSDIGTVPVDGGAYLKFLLAVRRIVEGSGSIDERLENLRTELHQQAWSDFVLAHQGKEYFYSYFFPEFLETIPKLPSEAVHQLWDRGIETPAQLDACSDADLLKIKGIGPARLRTIREACASVTDRNAKRLDLVNR